MPNDAKPVIDGPGIYLLRGGGHGEVVSVRGGRAVGFTYKESPLPGADAIVSGTKWAKYSGGSIGLEANIDDDILGPVTEPVAPPGMAWDVAGVMDGGVPLWRVGNLDLRDLHGIGHEWVFYDDSRGRGSMPLHAALGRLWAAVLEGK